MTTVTTVGYGDFAPETAGGRVIAMFVMVIGIGFVALLTAAAAERFIRRGEDPPAVEARLEEVSARLGAIERRLGDQPSAQARASSTPSAD